MYRKVKLFLCLISTLALSGCLGDLNQGLPLLQGQHVSVVGQFFGPSDGERFFAGNKYYIWRRSVDSKELITTQDNINTVHNIARVGDVASSRTSYSKEQYIPKTYVCEITAIVDYAEYIQKIDYDGDYQACEYFSRRIAPLVRANEAANRRY